MDNVSFYNIQYRPDLGIIRDIDTNKILAYYSKNIWKVKLENFPDGNVPLKESILEIIKGINELSLTSVDLISHFFIQEFPIVFERTKKEYSLKKLENTLIAMEVNNQDIESEQDSLLNILSDLNIVFYKLLNPHISLSYLNSSIPISILEEEIINTSKKQWHFIIKAIKILPGLTTPRDYISFELTTPDDFTNFIDRIHHRAGCEKMKFPGGFKAHISLLSIDKGALSEEIIANINHKIYSYTMKISPIIKPRYVTLFNKDKLTEIKKKFKNVQD
jgi:hypothetical protein